MAKLNYYNNTMVDNGNRQDYSKLMSNAMLEGKSADYVQSLYDSRLNMINSDKNLEKYRNDDIMKQAQEYIKKNTKVEAPPTTTEQAMSDMKNIYIGKDSMYAQALKNSQAATDASVKKAVGELEAQKTSTNQGYADLFKQLYQEKKGTEKNIDQQLAHQGITGGMSETTRLGIDTGYADALRQGEQERLKGISDINRAITDVRLDGDIAKAQAAIDANNQAMAGYASYLQTVLNRADNEAAIQREQDAILRSEVAKDKSYAYQYALAILQNGAMPSDELLASAGISKVDARRIADSANYDKNLAVTNQDKSYAYQYVISMLNNGAMPSDEALALAGIPKADAQAYQSAVLAKKEKNSTYGDTYSHSSLDDVIKDTGIVDNKGLISRDGWEFLQIEYPGITEADLTEIGYTLGNYFTFPEYMSDAARQLYSEIANAQTLNPMYNQDVIQAYATKKITSAEYNTLLRLLAKKLTEV